MKRDDTMIANGGILYRFSVIYNAIEVSSWIERLPDDEAADALLDVEDKRVAAELEEAAQEYGYDPHGPIPVVSYQRVEEKGEPVEAPLTQDTEYIPVYPPEELIG